MELSVGGGILGTDISPPSQYIHSSFEVPGMQDIEAGVQLLIAALKKKPVL